MEIIYQDKDVIAVHKPAGMPMHPDRFHQGDTVADWAISQFPEVEGVGDHSSRPEQGYRAGTVHRLDKDTSGVLVIARNQQAFEFLKKQFQERRIVKEYRVLVVGRLKDKKGTIHLPIGRAKNDPVKRIAKGRMRGTVRDAITEYEVIEYFGDDFTFIKVFPKTGRTHQVRSHFKAIDHPVVCDKLYAGKRFVCPFGLERQFLHAFALEAELPSSGRIRLEAEMTEDLQNVLEGLRKDQKDGTL
ncbi:MAG: RluA family pseudouridine synthase [Candidatus Niyogibacteria bacterium]|nr:RluA family pseudouridine synthase [Candidatus Niyogibacteria bacterium]